MSDDLLGAIDDLATDGPLTVTRTTLSPYVDGIVGATGTTTTFTIVAVVEPAYNQSRVIGGANLSAKVDGQSANDVRVIYTTTQLYTISQQYLPDVVALEGRLWTVARVERWALNDEVHYRVILTLQTDGAA